MGVMGVFSGETRCGYSVVKCRKQTYWSVSCRMSSCRIFVDVATRLGSR